MESKDHKYPRLISNRPCNKDLFEGKAHDKLAKAIADVISSDEKPSMIGIDGGWGSGKSNLVGMVSDHLNAICGEGEKKYHFFTYDVWGHQNDLPRRSILEELTTDLVSGEPPILEEDKWKEKRDNLLSKKRNTKSKVVPKINYVIIAASVLIILTPFIGTISSVFNKQWLNITLAVLPYLIIIGLVIRQRIKDLKKNEQEVNCKNFFTELFLLYNDKITENETFETISEREPSSKQFNEWVKDIDDSLKEANKNLVIVFDNMDRLPKSKVQEFWAAIHSFFSEANYSKISVIVPFDRAHIQNAFQSEDIDNTDEDCESTNEKRPRLKQRICYGNDFINKTFDIVFSVPPPILSGWKKYFRDMWKEAFGPNTDADPDVLQIFDKLTPENSPRKIIAFINSFVTLKKTADNTIEDKYIALYIFGREHIAKDPLSQILDPTYLGALDFMYKNDQRMQECMSSLYYQLPSNDAMDVIFSNKLKVELDNNTPNTIVELKESNKYWSILFSAILDVTNIKNATLALTEILDDSEQERSSKIWSALYKKAMKNMKSTTEYEEYEEYHKILASKLTQKERRAFVEALIRQYHENISLRHIDNYIYGIDELSSVEKEIYEILKGYNTKVEAKEYFTLVIMKKALHVMYGVTVKEEDFDNYITNLSPDKAAITSIYPHINKTFKTPKYVERIKKLFKDATHSDLETTKNLIERIKEIESRPFDINQYWDDTKIYNIFSNASKDDDIYYEVIAMMISRWSEYTTYKSNFRDVLDSSDETLVKKVSDVIECYTDYGDILENFYSYSPSCLISQIAKELTVNNKNSSRLSIKNTLSHYQKIIENSDITAEELLDTLNGWSKYLIEIDKSDVESLPISLFADAQRIDNELTKHCLQIAKEYLTKFSQEEWKNSFTKEDYKFKLLKVYHPCPITNCFDAFKEVTRSYANGTTPKPINISVANEVIKISEDIGRNLSEFFTGIRDIFVSSASITSEKIKYFGKLLFKYGKLEDNPKSLEKIFPTEFIDNDEIINLLIEHKEIVKVLVANSQNSNEFKQKVEALLTGRKNSDKQFVEFCESIGIRKNSEESSSEA